MNINWADLRPLDDTQNNAFEELCCQLARYEEEVPVNSLFTRKGKPDAGVECYWVLTDETEWVWQAKYFRSSPGTSQWNQIKRSTKTAIDKHPKISRLYICLPIDRSDARKENEKSFKEKWDEFVEEYVKYGQEKNGRIIEFVYWGESEIIDRLSKDEHKGRFFFWFNKELFTSEWYHQKFEETRSDVRHRYTTELNVELPIARYFDGLCCTEEYINIFRIHVGKVIKSFHGIDWSKIKIFDEENCLSIDAEMTKLLKEIENPNFINNVVNWDDISTSLSALDDKLHKYARTIEDQVKQERKLIQQLKLDEIELDETKKISRSLDVDYLTYKIRELQHQLWNLIRLTNDNATSLVKKPVMLLVGEAGIGKTHLLCDIAVNRIKNDKPTILLLGHYFNSNDPWETIKAKLDFNKSVDELLGVIEASAQIKDEKALFIIDALNESDNPNLWFRGLNSFLTKIKKYPWISVALSYRSDYEDIVIPEGFDYDKIVKILHTGFRFNLHEALTEFCEIYSLELPTFPMLQPEFINPLFLKTFCEGLNNNKSTKFPENFWGVTKLFDYFLSSVNKKLSHPTELDFDKDEMIVQKAVREIAHKMADKQVNKLTKQEVKDIADSIYTSQNGYENSLYRNLLSEGIISEFRFENQKFIKFTYERFSDFMIAQYIIDDHLDYENLESSFNENTPLGELIKDEYACAINRGLLNSISILIPERTEKELIDIAPHCKNFDEIKRSFVTGLLYRKPESITDNTFHYINHVIFNDEEFSEMFFDIIVTLSGTPNHPLNSDSTHKFLMNFEMPKRDCFWSTYLHNQYSQVNAVNTIINWTWQSNTANNLDNDSARLCAKMLSWFLTTPNRFVRDKATKALVSLLTNRIETLIKTIDEFKNVDDPYILERLMAVAYGCAMQSSDIDMIKKLAIYIYNTIFSNDNPPLHILLRCYAMCTIELALQNGSIENIDISNITPPYKSELPIDILSKEDFEAKEISFDEMSTSERVLKTSIMTSGDFSSYIIGTNMNESSWSSIRIDEEYVQPSTRLELFASSLNEKQILLFDNYMKLIKIIEEEKIKSYKLLIQKQNSTESEKSIDTEKIESELLEHKENLLRILDEDQKKEFTEFVSKFVKSPHLFDRKPSYDLSSMQRWIYQRVFDLGWSDELFGDFDEMLIRGYTNRTANKPERIGKKYQWIAFYEFLAWLSDNYTFKGEYDQDTEYNGTWQISHHRDIDPSIIIEHTSESEDNSWWFNEKYDAWSTSQSHEDWLKNEKDLPQIEKLIQINQGAENWLNFESTYRWKEPTEPYEDEYSISKRYLWLMLRSYIVHKKDVGCVYDWGLQKNFMGRWMPESSEYSTFLGEFYNSLAYEYLNQDDFEWINMRDYNLDAELLITCERYMWENGGYDCSINKPIHIHLPCKWLVDQLKLKRGLKEGHFYNINNDLTAFDPSVYEKGINALLFNKQIFIDFLRSNDLEIVWTIIGEKQLIGSNALEDSPGITKFSGIYKLNQDDDIDGKIKHEYNEW